MSQTIAEMSVSEPLASTGERSRNADQLERRASLRHPRKLKALLLGRGLDDGLMCQTTNISEGGICVQVPESSGLTVGQRYEVLLTEESEAPDLACFLTGGCYATVVRTARGAAPAPGALGAGLRFDQPLYF